MKKLFTLLTLLVAIVTGAQAQNPTYKSDFTDGQIIWTTSSNVDAAITAGWMKMNSTLSKKDLKGKKLIDPTTNEEASSAQYSNSEYFYVQKTFNSKASSDKSLYLYVSGLTKMTIYFYQNSDGGGRTMEAYNGEGSDATKLAGADVIDGGRCGYFDVTLDGEDNIIRLNATNELLLYAIKVEKAPAGPSITTHPESATYADGDPISALTVTATASAGNLSYQWYKCDDANKTNAEAIDGATAASFTPTEEGFYYVNVKDGNGNVDSNVAHVEIEAPSAPTISIAAGGSTEVTAGASITLTAMAAGVPGPNIQWYVSDTNDTSAGTAISGATNATYTFDAVAGTKYYYATASNKVQSNVPSNVVTVTAAARTGYALNQVVFSNSFDAFITAPVAAVYFTQEEIDAAQDGDAAYGKTTEDIKTPAVAASIKAYYMQGETAPTVSSVIMSPGATYAVADNTLTVTSEDGLTSVAYPITVEAVTPYDGVGKLTFDGTETWVKSGYGFSTDSGKLGYKIAKTDNDWSRERDGRTRIYFFLAPTATVTFENGGTARNIKVYKNGTLLESPTSTSSCEIEGDTENNFMIAIVSNQTNGDGALKSITTPVPTLTLDDTSNGNATKIAALNGKTANVTVERNLATTYYNTLFLPFAMTAEQMTAAFGEGAQVATFVKMNSATEFGFGNVTAWKLTFRISLSLLRKSTASP